MTPIPQSAVLPVLSSNAVSEVLTILVKVSLVINGFGLSLDGVVYLHDHGSDFADEKGRPLKLNALTLGCWHRLQAYTALCDKLPK